MSFIWDRLNYIYSICFRISSSCPFSLWISDLISSNSSFLFIIIFSLYFISAISIMEFCNQSSLIFNFYMIKLPLIYFYLYSILISFSIIYFYNPSLISFCSLSLPSYLNSEYLDNTCSTVVISYKFNFISWFCLLM